MKIRFLKLYFAFINLCVQITKSKRLMAHKIFIGAMLITLFAACGRHSKTITTTSCHRFVSRNKISVNHESADNSNLKKK